MALWLLEAKAFLDDDRGVEARETKFLLRPGTYTVGRAGAQADIDVSAEGLHLLRQAVAAALLARVEGGRQRRECTQVVCSMFSPGAGQMGTAPTFRLLHGSAHLTRPGPRPPVARTPAQQVAQR